jgi:hypothetical protein
MHSHNGTAATGNSYRAAGGKVAAQVARRQEQCHPNITAEVLPKKSVDLHKSLIRSCLQAAEIGFEPRMVVFRWHSPRIAFTSQSIEAPTVKAKPRCDHIVCTLHSRGQHCPQFAPI